MKKTVCALTFVLAMGISLSASARQGGQSSMPAAPVFEMHPMRMTILDFPDGGHVPVKNSCLGKGHGVSPAIEWRQVPAGTKSFILLVHDPEAHHNNGVEDVTHWMIWNIPGTARALPEGVPAGLTLPDGAHQVQGRGGPTGVYFGPCAPPAGYDHHYIFNLYALDTMLDLPETATRAQVMAAANGHLLSSVVWIGLFHR